MPKKIRIDLLLIERGLAESRSQAQRLVMAGQVRANGQVVPKPASKVDAGAELTIDHGPRFVSRGGEKLQAAFDAFELDLRDRACADVGASTGGFTDCLLQHGAAKVYAIDVGKGILHWKMRKHPRVVVMERTNARFVDSLPEPVSFVSIDASFISLKILLPVIKGWFTPLTSNPLTNELEVRRLGEIVALIKPQFEAGRREVARGKGVVRDPEIHWRVLLDVLTFAEAEGFQIRGLIRSPLLGPKGNTEFLAWLVWPARDADYVALEMLLRAVQL
ncbi:MAG: TlyA family RNA methyltransferase [Chloroflexi bacterium]|nr:TlyA family RNA methyltransferase [Chloroflexota bacterium]